MLYPVGPVIPRIRPLICGLLVLGSTAQVRAAHAWCRTTTCELEQHGSTCLPKDGTICGMPLYWPRQCMSFSLQQAASTQVDYASALQVINSAFATWTAADCGGGSGPAIRVTDSGPSTIEEVGGDAGIDRVNLIIFRDESWSLDPGILALTTVSFGVQSGRIFDVDVEINTHEHKMSVDGTNGYDLSAVLVHELGHYFGLAHSQTPGATMSTTYSASMTGLSPDDVAGICQLYPPPTTTFEKIQTAVLTSCEEEGASSGCVTRSAVRRESGWLVMAGILLVAAAVLVRRSA